MQDCDHELNKQLKGILARLSQAEDNITSQFAATSLLVQNLLADPITAGGASAVAGIYNMVPAGFAAVQALIKQVGALDYKKLMMEGAATAMDSMEAELDALAAMVETAMTDAIASAESALTSLENAAANAATSTIDALAALPSEVVNQVAGLTTAITGGVTSEINSAVTLLHDAMVGIGGIPSQIQSSLTALFSAKTAVSSAQDALTSLKGVAANATSMLTSQSDAAKCKSVGMVIN